MTRFMQGPAAPASWTHGSVWLALQRALTDRTRVTKVKAHLAGGAVGEAISCADWLGNAAADAAAKTAAQQWLEFVDHRREPHARVAYVRAIHALQDAILAKLPG